MPKLILLLCLFYTSNIFAQSKYDLAFLENYFTKYIDGFTTTINGRKIDNRFLEREIDSTLLQLSKTKIPKTRLSTLYPYYHESESFRKIIRDIDTIPITVTSLRQNYNQIYSRMEALDIKTRLYALMHFHKHFYPLNDEQSLEALKRSSKGIANMKVSSASDTEAVEILSALGDFLVEFGAPSFAFEIYLEAAYMADTLKDFNNQGFLHEKIARIYSHRNIDAYQDKNIKHLQTAADLYYKGKNYLRSFICRFKAGSNIIWSNSQFRLIDLAVRGNPEGYDFETLANKTADFNDSLKRQNVLSVAYNAVMNFRNDNSGEFEFQLYRMLGDYFYKFSDISVAKAYYQNVFFICLFKNNYDGLIDALRMLSAVHSTIGDTSKTVKYIDHAIQLTKALNIDPWNASVNYMVFNKSEFLQRIGIYEKAILYCNEALKNISEYPEYIQDGLFERHAELLSQIYTDLKMQDSAKFYYDIYTEATSGYLDELSLMTQIELDHTKDLFNNSYLKLQQRNNTLLENTYILQNSFNKKLKMERLLNSKISMLNTETEELKNMVALKNDSLTVLDRQLEDRIDSINVLERIGSDLSRRIMIKEKSLKNIRNILIVAILGLVAMFITIAAINYSRKKLLENTLLRTDNDSRNFIHNFASDFSEFTSVIDMNKSPEAFRYAEKYSEYLDLAYKKKEWHHKSWSINKEMQLMQKYYEARKLIKGEITIVKSIEGSENSRCLAGAFITILDNFFKHQDKTKQPTFKISITRENKIVHFELTDNGIPSSPESYFRDDKKEQGLTYLRTRIVAISKTSKFTRHLKNVFEVEPIKGVGTTIKFILPHAEI